MKLHLTLLFVLCAVCVASKEIGVDSIAKVDFSLDKVHKLVRRHGDHSHSHDEDEHDHEDSDHIHEPSLQSSCGDYDLADNYDTPLHIGIVFIMAFTSFLGCSLTALGSRIPFLKLPTIAIDIGRHFGTGVILSTAFIHMLMSSVFNLTHKCAPQFFQDYSSSAPLIAMLAALALHLIEYLVLDFVGRKLVKVNTLENQEPFEVENGKGLISDSGCSHEHSDILLLTERKISTYILEFGILSHSIFIGLSLGVASGPEFIPLLIAVLFHQFFEGIGLGARISKLEFPSIAKPLLMVFFFSVTTSLGILIGIAIHSSYSASSPISLAVQGVFDAISAGILIYTGLVELLAREINVKSEFNDKRWSVKVIYFVSLYAGVATMAIIGIWA